MNYLALTGMKRLGKHSRSACGLTQRIAAGAVLGMAIYEEAMGNNEAAERNYKAAVVAGNPEALKMLGMFLYRNGRGPEAIEHLQESRRQGRA